MPWWSIRFVSGDSTPHRPWKTSLFSGRDFCSIDKKGICTDDGTEWIYFLNSLAKKKGPGLIQADTIADRLNRFKGLHMGFTN